MFFVLGFIFCFWSSRWEYGCGQCFKNMSVGKNIIKKKKIEK
jgi:hypothetical protein